MDTLPEKNVVTGECYTTPNITETIENTVSRAFSVYKNNDKNDAVRAFSEKKFFDPENCLIISQFFPDFDSFEVFTSDKGVSDLLFASDPKNLEKVIHFYGNSEDSLRDMCNNKSISTLLKLSKFENFELVLDLYSEGKENFEFIANNIHIIDILRISQGDVLDFFLKLYGNTKETVELISTDTSICKILKHSDVFTLQKLLEIHGGEKESMKEIYGNKNTLFLAKYAKYENLHYIFDRFQVTSTQDLENLYKEKKWEHILKLLKNGNQNQIETLLNLNPEECVISNIGEANFNSGLTTGTCDSSEKHHNAILTTEKHQKKLSSIPIFCGNQIVAYIKKGEYITEKLARDNLSGIETAESLLALENVQGSDGTIIFLKGMLYAHNFDTNKNKIKLKKGESIHINPIRMINIENFDEGIEKYKQSQSGLRRFFK